MKIIKPITICATAILLGVFVALPSSAQSRTFPFISNIHKSVELSDVDTTQIIGGITTFNNPLVVSEFFSNHIGDSVKFFSLIPASGEPVAEPGTEYKRRHSPDNGPGEGNKRGVGVEKQHVFTQGEILQILMWGPLSTLVMFPLGMYFSLYISPAILEKRRRWMKYHNLKKKRFEQAHPEQYYRRPAKTFCQRIWF
jgi:hypothetical protein